MSKDVNRKSGVKRGLHRDDVTFIRGAIVSAVFAVAAACIDTQAVEASSSISAPVILQAGDDRSYPSPAPRPKPRPVAETPCAVAKSADAGASRNRVRAFAFYAAEQASIDPHIFWGLLLSESGGDPKAGCSGAGACGIGQLMQVTAEEMGVNRFDWRENVLGSAFYLAKKRREFGGDMTMAIAAYNAGAGTISRWAKSGAHFERLPLETQRYIGKVQMNASKSRRMEEVQVAWEGI